MSKLHIHVRNLEHSIDFESLGLHETQVIVLSDAGSNLYGTATPESDVDYLGVFVPTKRQLLLNNFPKQVHLPKSSGLDAQLWSIHYFLKLACQGETMAMDLLHAPFSCWKIFNNDIWPELYHNSHLFYTKEMKSFVSYARKQAAKYGIKGTRIEAYEDVIKFLSNYAPYNAKLKDVWDKLPAESEHIHFLNTEPFKMYQVCGKKYQETVKVSYALEHLKKDLTGYGSRAMLARKNEGVDWKAISHALRSAYQVWDILTIGTYTFPCPNADYLRDIKQGKIDFTEVQNWLELLMKNIEEMIPKSNLPDEVDKEYWDDWLIETLNRNLF